MTVSRKTFETRCADGVWECIWEPNSFGRAEVRVTKTGHRKSVVVREAAR